MTISKRTLRPLVALVLVLLPVANAWAAGGGGPPPAETAAAGSLSRRDAIRDAAASLLFSGPAAAAVLGGAALPPPASAAAAGALPTAAELQRLSLGRARVRYLLDHWDDITQSCNNKAMSDTEKRQVVRTEGGGGGICDKNPLRVQEFLGYKSTTDPLFKVDKLMLRAGPMVDADDFEDYLSVVEAYREKADNGSMMAYTSSWGEANPNGSKDAIDEYLERTKDDVKSTEKLLLQVMKYLNVEPIPALKGPL